MSISDPVYIGIDLTSSREECVYAIVDRDLNLIKLVESEIESMLAFLATQKTALVAINAPSKVNQGIVKANLIAQNQDGDHQYRGTDLRLAEYELRQLGIAIAGTPGREELCTGWMRVGFELFRELANRGYKEFPIDGASLRMTETHPQACFCVLLEQTPFPHPTLEGRLQRQLILHDKGLRINDPMEFFEEITRFKLLNGILPLDTIYTFGQLDVLVAAYSAWAGDNLLGAVCMIGDKREGQIMLPVNELREKY
jgi:predicted nuclease with RNAse H fold